MDIRRKNKATANQMREYSSLIFCLLIKLKTKIKRKIDTPMPRNSILKFSNLHRTKEKD